jgi:succinate dehydrogenase / fumarate reductase cytochrome b subunit
MWRIYSIHNVLFILHRITGVALLAYLLVHIGAVSTAMISGPESFDSVMAILTGRVFFALELALLACLTFHALNGLRLILAERGLSPAGADALVRVAVVSTLAIGIAAALVAAGS